MADTHETPERGAPIRALIANAGDMAGMFSDIDRLRDGEYMRAWHSFPTTKEDLQSTLKEIDLDGARGSDCIIIDYETDIPGLYGRLPVGADIDELCFLSARLAGMTEPEREVFGAAMLSGRHCGSIMDIINVTENLYLFDVQPAYNVETYGEFFLEVCKNEYAEVFKSLETSDYPEEYLFAQYIERLEKHVDPVAFGRSVAEEENGVFTACGYLTESEGFREVYRGPEDIPAEYRVSTPPERTPGERASVMDKLAAAKEAAGKINPDKSDKPVKSHDAEL